MVKFFSQKGLNVAEITKKLECVYQDLIHESMTVHFGINVSVFISIKVKRPETPVVTVVF